MTLIWGIAAMAKATVTFRTEADTGAALDRLASVLDRDRSYLINEAVEAFLPVHAWQIDHIADGLRPAEAGEFADEQKVAALKA